MNSRDSWSLFRSSDKQMLINHIMRSPVVEGGAGLGEHTPLSDSIEVALPLHMYVLSTKHSLQHSTCEPYTAMK